MKTKTISMMIIGMMMLGTTSSFGSVRTNKSQTIKKETVVINIQKTSQRPAVVVTKTVKADKHVCKDCKKACKHQQKCTKCKKNQMCKKCQKTLKCKKCNGTRNHSVATTWRDNCTHR